jgi:Arc/MetJ-type ribon-helix-helix transcriptional regulator
MTLTLGPEAQKIIDERMKHGGYATPEDVVIAALALMGQSEDSGDFAPGELDRLIEEGERGGDDLDGEQVLAELRDLRERSPSGSK